MIELFTALAIGKTYYVSLSGDDMADGLSKSHAWKSLDRVSRESFQPGDRVLLAGGETFVGSLRITNGGTKEKPLVITSDGTMATIVSPESSAITLSAGGVELRKLALVGKAEKAKKDHDGVRMVAPTGQPAAYVRIEDLDISGFGGAGISMTSEKGNRNGFQDVKISKTRVHGNYDTGIITSDGVAFDLGVYAHHRLLITDCDVSNNLGGNGIIISGVDGGVVEFCRSTNNRGAEGALGMWAWCAKNITFRYNIANGTRGKGDGGGYDLDGGTVDCVVEHCLSFDNDGPGYMHCDFPSAPKTQRNIIRRSVSVDDGRKAKGEPYGFGYVVWGTGLYDCRIEKNLAVVTKDDELNRENGALFATFIRMEEVPLEKQRLDGGQFIDNVVQVSGKGVSFVRNNFPNRFPNDVVFRGNSYWSNLQPPFIEGAKGETQYKSLGEWQKGTQNDLKSPVKPALSLGNYTALRPRDLPNWFRKLGL